jgi:hypothetical protein
VVSGSRQDQFNRSPELPLGAKEEQEAHVGDREPESELLDCFRVRRRDSLPACAGLGEVKGKLRVAASAADGKLAIVFGLWRARKSRASGDQRYSRTR